MSTLGPKTHPRQPSSRRAIDERRLDMSSYEASPCAVRRFDRSRWALVMLAGVLALAFAGFRADASSALTTAANCALPGSDFQGGDGNQDPPTLTEQAFCTEHL